METWRTPLDPEQILEHGPWLRALARALVRDPIAAEDLAQEAWLVVGRKGDVDRAELRPFLRGVVRRIASTWRRGERRRAARELHAAPPNPTNAPEHVAAQLELQERLIRELRELGEPYRTTLVMRFYGGLSSAEIARQTRSVDATVRARLARGLAELRKRLERNGAEDGGDWRAAWLPLVGVSSFEATREAATVGGLAWLVAGCALVAVAGVAAQAAWPSRSERREVSNAELAAAPPQRIKAPAAVAHAPSTQRTSALASAQRTEPSTSEPDPLARAPRGFDVRVVDERGDPISDVALDLLFIGLPEPTLTNAIRVAHVVFDAATARDAAQREDAIVEFSMAGFATLRVSRSFQPAEVTWFGDVVMRPAGRLEGRVTDLNGAAVPHAHVWATSEAAVEEYDVELGPGRIVFQAAEETFADADGRYEFANLVDSRRNVWATSPRHAFTRRDSVAIRGGETTRLDLKLVPLTAPRAIAGVLLDADGEPARGTVRLYGPDGSTSWDHECWASFDGRFEVRVARPETVWRLVALDFEGKCAPLEREVRAGEIDLRLQFDASAAIAARVIDEEERPIAGAWVYAMGRDGAGIEGTNGRAGVDGRARVRWPWSAVAVGATAPGYRVNTVDAPQEGEEVVVKLQRGPGISGRVTFDGEPVRGASLALYRTVDGDGAFRAHIEDGRELDLLQFVAPQKSSYGSSGADGGFTIRAPSSDGEGIRPYMLLASAPGYATAIVGPLDLDDESRLEDVRVELTRGGGVHGRVASATGESLAGWRVLLADGRGDLRQVDLSPDGEFRIQALAAGLWQIAIAPAGPLRLVRWRPTEVRAFGTRTVEVVEGEFAEWNGEFAPPQRVVLEGRLHIDAEPMGLWTASASPIDGEGAAARVPLDADGAFYLALDGAGRYRLQVTSSDARWGAAWFIDELDVGPRGAKWSADAEFARISDISENGARGSHTAVRLDGGGRRFGCTFDVDDAGTLVDVWVPAGRVQLLRGASDYPEVLGVHELIAGELHRLKLP